MALKTELSEILNIKYPIIQGGMAWTSTAELAVAVSEGGGIGIIGAGGMPPDVLKKEIKKAKSLTKKPFGVNLMLMNARINEQLKILKEEQVSLITTGAGNPGKYLAEFKNSDTKVIPVVPSVAIAKRAEKQGAVAVIAEGTEAGGHVGELTTMCLVLQVSQAVNIPVIAAGGIGSGRAIAAVFALGAKGVQIGTRFIASDECTVHQNVKDALVKARDRDTIVTGRATGHPVRVIRNSLTKELEQLDSKNKAEELEKRAVGTLRKAMKEGDVQWGSLMAGQISGLIKEIKPAAEIINELVAEAEKTIKEIQQYA